MKRIVVDTNVLVSFLTDRDARQQARAARLFEAAAAGEVQLILHQLVATELIYVLRTVYAVDAALVAVTRAGKHDAIATFDDRFIRRLSRLRLATAW